MRVILPDGPCLMRWEWVMKKFFIIFTAVVVALLLFFICSNMLGIGTGTKRPDPTFAPTTPPTTPPKERIGKAVTTIKEGSWEVGVDVAPGKYKTSGAVPNAIVPLCYWEVRDNSETGAIVGQGAKDKLNEQGLVTIKKGQFFITSGCEDWTVR